MDAFLANEGRANISAAPNPAIASLLQAGHHWRGVGEPTLAAIDGP